MEAQGNGTAPPGVDNVEAPLLAPVTASVEADQAGPAITDLAEPALARPPVPPALATATIANMAALAVVPLRAVPVVPHRMVPIVPHRMVPVVAPPAGQGMANLAGRFDIGSALGGSDPPSKRDMRYKIWQKL